MLEAKNWAITKENIKMHEMIGLEVKVSSPNLKKAIKGKVVDETKNIFVIEKEGREVKVPKRKGVFEFFLGDVTAIIEGENIMYAPQQRLKYCKGD